MIVAKYLKRGIKEIESKNVDSTRIRKIGGGRKKKLELHPEWNYTIYPDPD